MSTEVGSLILEVKDEPQLDARIGNGQADAIGFSLLDGLSHIRVRINVEHAPDLVVGSTPTSLLISQLRSFCGDRFVNK